MSRASRSSPVLGMILALALLLACEGRAGPDTTSSVPARGAPATSSTTTSTAAGPATGEGIVEGTIRLGVLATLSGPVADLGASVAAGHRLYWRYVSQDLGGVGGELPVELVERDNAYDQERNRAAFEEISGGILAVSSTLGTPMTSSILRQAAELDLLVAAGSQASFWARADNVVLSLGGNTYLAQFANGPYWAMELADPPLMEPDTPVGILYQDDDYGEDCLAGYELARSELGFDDALRQTYQPGQRDLGPPMIAFRDAGVEVVFVCALPSTLGRIVTADLVIGYDPLLLGSSATYLPILPFLLGGEDGEQAGLEALSRYLQLGAGPSLEDESPGMKLLRENLERFGEGVESEQVNSYLYFGYTQAATVHAVLERAYQRGDLTRNGVLAAVDEVGEVDLGFGFGPGGFGPTPAERIPTNTGAVGRVVSVSARSFGIERISDWFAAPYLADYDFGPRAGG